MPVPTAPPSARPPSACAALRLAALAATLAAATLAAGASAGAAHAQEPAARPLLWRVADADSRVYLLGSVHALPAGTDVLPGAAADAYADAEVVAFEVDLSTAQAALAGVVATATATDGVDLSKRLGPADAARLGARLARGGLVLADVEAFEPWFVALLLAGVPDGGVRYDAAAGVDVQLHARAGTDGRERVALETAADQLDALGGLPLKDQLAFLRDALADDTDDGGGFAAIIAAWQAGDADALARLLADGASASPILRQRVFTDRNARWTPQIEALLARADAAGRPQDALVVVGAGHLVGPDSVVEMLRARGLDVARVE